MNSATPFGRVTGFAEQPNEEGAEAVAGEGERKGNNGNASGSLSASVGIPPHVVTRGDLSAVACAPTAMAPPPMHGPDRAEEEVRVVARAGTLSCAAVPSASCRQVQKLRVAPVCRHSAVHGPATCATSVSPEDVGRARHRAALESAHLPYGGGPIASTGRSAARIVVVEVGQVAPPGALDWAQST